MIFNSDSWDLSHFTLKQFDPFMEVCVLVSYVETQKNTHNFFFDLAFSFSRVQRGGGTMEIMVNGTTVWLHPDGKEGVTPLVENIVKMATHVERQLTMGKKGYEEGERKVFGTPHVTKNCVGSKGGFAHVKQQLLKSVGILC